MKEKQTYQIILRNAIQCRKCGDVIESTNVHAFVRCRCGAVAVDGGHEYLRRCGYLEDMMELSETKEVTREEAFAWICAQYEE